MARLRYTGLARALVIDGKTYAHPDDHDPKIHDGSLDKPIPGMTQALAKHLIEASQLHSFVLDDGEDFEDKLTRPVSQAQDATLVASVTEDSKKK